MSVVEITSTREHMVRWVCLDELKAPARFAVRSPLTGAWLIGIDHYDGGPTRSMRVGSLVLARRAFLGGSGKRHGGEVDRVMIQSDRLMEIITVE